MTLEMAREITKKLVEEAEANFSAGGGEGSPAHFVIGWLKGALEGEMQRPGQAEKYHAVR